jgi:hypothetical protein
LMFSVIEKKKIQFAMEMKKWECRACFYF